MAGARDAGEGLDFALDRAATAFNPLYSPRVIGDKRPDYHSLATLVASPAFAGKSGEELVLALYDHFTSTVDGTYHFWPAGENEGHPLRRWNCVDPVKILNAYGWAICGQNAAMMAAIYRAAGLPARQFSVPGHVLCEVFYDRRWHVLDVDMRTWFRAPGGHIASAAELAADPRALILDNQRRSDPCNLPDRSLADYAAMYAQCDLDGGDIANTWPEFNLRCQRMDFRLRPGETLVRAQTPRGRFHMPGDWREMIDKHATEWRGYPRERFEPYRSYGNGRWLYAPDLRAGSPDFRAGVWEVDGLRQEESGLLGPGSAVWRMQSPYPFCGVPDWSGDTIRHSDGVWIQLAGKGDIGLWITDPGGDWVRVVASRDLPGCRQDVTQLLTSRYACRLRVELGPGAMLERFAFDGCVMCAPASLPRLEEGENELELRAGDDYGLCTVPWSQWADFRSGSNLLRQWAGVDNARAREDGPGWMRLAPAGPGPVVLVYAFKAPAGRRCAWLYAFASMREGPHGEPRRGARLDWSADGSEWLPLAAGEVSNSPQGWDASLDGEARFPRPLDKVLVRLTSPTAVSGFGLCGHLLERAPGAGVVAGLEIIHRWQEGRERREFRVPRGTRRYSIHCRRRPEEHVIVMRARAGSPPAPRRG